VLISTDETLAKHALSYVQAIMSPEDTTFDRLECPAPNEKRYRLLQSNARLVRRHLARRPNYFFALDLHQSVKKLPRLLGTIVETMRFLGPEHCALSVVEGYSDDGTYEVLDALRGEMKDLGAEYFFKSSLINPKQGDRITALAELRNEALQPMVVNPENYAPDTTVIFLNDVSLCMEDILELLWQRIFQGADMTCAMDWTYVGRDPTFYDVWIARGMTGDSFFNIPEDGNWNSAWNLFWNDPKAQEALNSHKPFQVFSCWNGAAVFTAKPLMEQKVRFRHAYKGECYQGEPKLFCKDMWKAGFGKIAVVPSVNIEYSDEQAKKIKALKGYASSMVNMNEVNDKSSLIQWQKDPPEKVKCMRNYADQVWVNWDEGLP
jgi:alpha-1,3-mannosyltransferase